MIDSHCHFDASAFDQDRDEMFSRSQNANVHRIISPAITAASWPKLKSVSDAYEQVLPCYGLHPMFLNQHRPEHIAALERWIRTEKPLAVGEIGLDFYLKELDRKQQQFYFEQQLDLAQKYALPVVVHARKSTERVIQTLKDFPSIKGVVHSYSGSTEQGRQLIARGFYLGFGGPITWERSKRLRRVVEELPLEGMLLETDAPDQTGEAHKGERNEPSYLNEVATTIAQLKNKSVEEVDKTTTANAKRLFKLKDIH